MNRLILIGNGFDLAHGLKTSYNDFILSYINGCFTEAWTKYNYDDDSIAIRRTAVMNEFPISSFRDLSQYLNHFYTTGYLPLLRNMEIDFKSSRYKPFFEVKVKRPFLEHLLLNCGTSQWVDIENEFYHQLKLILHSQLNDDKSVRLRELNDSLASIIVRLEIYLNGLETPPVLKQYRELFLSDIKSIEVPLDKLRVNEYPRKTHIVNFNYTSTVQKYFSTHSNSNVTINYIHGKLNDPKNRLVFGFGDELDDDYLKMEKERIKGYFEYIKSFWYSKRLTTGS